MPLSVAGYHVAPLRMPGKDSGDVSGCHSWASEEVYRKPRGKGSEVPLSGGNRECSCHHLILRQLR